MTALARFHHEAPFWPWLRCIGDNVARSDLRSRRGACGKDRDVYIDEDAWAQTPADTDDEGRVDDGASLLVALRAIPDRQREAFIAVAHGGAPMALAALDFGLNENAFRQLYHRARNSLRQQLEGVLGVAPIAWWYRLRSTIMDGLVPRSTAMLAQSAAAVVGVVAIVVLAPAMDPEGSSPTNRGRYDAHTAASLAQSAGEVPIPHGRARRPVAAGGRAQDIASAGGSSVDAAAGGSSGDAADAADGSTTARTPLVEAPSAHVGGSGIRGHQETPTDPDSSYGVRVDAPGVPRQDVRYTAKDSRVAPVHEVACEVAASTPVTYCDSRESDG